MNAFQFVSLIVLSLAFIRDARKWLTTRSGRKVRMVRCAVWSAAALTICIPDQLTYIAQWFGIERGMNLLLYVSVLTFMWAAFALYMRSLRLERELTALTRHLAIRDAVRVPPNEVTPTS